MSYYISSNENRLYVQTEGAFATVGAISSTNRIPAVKLAIKTEREHRVRKDKTGRTFQGLPTGLRTRTKFRLNTYMTSWGGDPGQSGHSPLFASAMGAAGIYFPGGQATVDSPTSLTFSSPHGLEPGQAVAHEGEIRFVATVRDVSRVDMNAPLNVVTGSNIAVAPTLTYRPGELPMSASIFDYWSPGDAMQRVMYGAVVDELLVKVNGDYHEFQFSGPAADVADNSTFASGQAGLTEFPEEPPIEALNYAIIPGHLGQVWMGATPDQIHTLTSAELQLKNDVELRASEFGQQLPTCFSAGMRDVSLRFSMYEKVDGATTALYQAARQRMPISVMLQLGAESGNLFGVYLQTMVPEVPEFDDDERRLQWRFSNCRAQGTSNDELILAFA